MKKNIRNKIPRILVSNDDGYLAPGLRMLVKSIQHLAKLIIVAPNQKRSGSSMSITNREHISLERIENYSSDGAIWYKSSGTPVDCIKLALSNLLESPPDLVIGGINRGYNIGNDSLYSGTVSIGLESATKGIPAICFSYGDISTNADYNCCQEPIQHLVQWVLNNRTNKVLLLNVNIPINYTSKRGMKICHQAAGYWQKEWTLTDIKGEISEYKQSGVFINSDENDIDSDIWALKQGKVSVVPLKTDLTDYKQINNLMQSNLKDYEE